MFTPSFQTCPVLLGQEETIEDELGQSKAQTSHLKLAFSVSLMLVVDWKIVRSLVYKLFRWGPPQGKQILLSTSTIQSCPIKRKRNVWQDQAADSITCSRCPMSQYIWSRIITGCRGPSTSNGYRSSHYRGR